MRQIEELQKRWQDSARLRGLHAAMSLEKRGLVLGAGTVLAKRTHDGGLALDGEEARLLTLLAVAYGQPVRPSVLSTIRNASKHARAGDESRAAMHIALGLPGLADPVDSARRLFIADGLISEGVDPRDIWTALEFDPAPLDDLNKFNPEEPRVPTGSGRTSGEWTSDGANPDAELPAAIAARVSTEAAAEVAESVATRQWWELLLELGARAAGPLAFLYTLLHSTPAGGQRREGKVSGYPDLRWTEDEGLLTITRESDGQTVLQAKRGADGNLRILQSAAVRRLKGEHSNVDPSRLPASDPRSSQRDDEPKLCPEPPRPDAPQGSARSWAYSDYVKAIVNQPPTPPKFGYQLTNPFDGGKVVKYDDCQRDTGTMIEIKGRGYARLLRNPKIAESIMYQWLSQATRQIEASGTRPVRWYFAEKAALEVARKLFNDSDHRILARIELRYLPISEGD